tara:strand:- start:388 stop:636 length:249 start_codon:yes stop_codon:yes gene_type:complete
MKKLRKANPKKKKALRKAAEEELATQVSLMQSHPKECCLCHTEFERSHETVKTWRVMIKEDKVRLTCPSCWGTIKEVVENER